VTPSKVAFRASLGMFRNLLDISKAALMTDRTFRSVACLTFYNFIIKDAHTLLPLKDA
jgi:hypothetical protein